MELLKKFKTWVVFVEGTISFFLFLVSFNVIFFLSVFFNISPLVFLTSIFVFLPFVFKLNYLSFPKLARIIEKTFPFLNEKILVFLDFKKAEDKRKKEIAFKIEKELLELKINYRKAYPFKKVLNPARIFLYSLILNLIFLCFFPYNYAKYFVRVPQSPFYLKVTPGNNIFFVPSNITIKAQSFGKETHSVFLTQEIKNTTKRERLTIENGFFSKNIFVSKPCTLKYRFEQGSYKTKFYTLAFLEKPFLTRWNIKIFPPKTLELEPESLFAPLPLLIFPGTQIEISAKLSVPSDSTKISFNKNIFKKIQKTQDIELTLIPKEKGELSFTHYIYGMEFEDPQKIRIGIGEDLAPEIRILFPPYDTRIGEEMKIPFELFVKDDISLLKVDLIYSIHNEENRKTLKTYYKEKEDSLIYILNLEPYELLLGDTVAVWFEAYDKGVLRKSKKTVSKKMHFWIPSFEEIYKETSAETEKGMSFLKGVGKEAEAIYKEVQKIREFLESSKEKSAVNKEEIERTIETVSEFAKEIEQKLNTLEKKFEELEKTATLDPELAEKIAKLNELFKEIMTEEMQKLLEELKRALMQIDPEKLRESIKKLFLNQELIKEQIERTIELLERVKQEVKLKELIERAKKLEQEIQKLQSEFSMKDASSNLKEIAKLRESLKEMEKEIQELSESFKGNESAIGEKLDEAVEKGKEGISELELAHTQLTQGKRGACQSSISKSKEKVSEMKNLLSSAQSMLQNLRSGELAKEMENAFFTSVYIAKEQGKIINLFNLSTVAEELETKVLSQKQAIGRFTEKLLSIARKSIGFSKKILDYAFSSNLEMENMKQNITLFEMQRAKENAKNVYNFLNLISLEILRLQNQAQSGSAQQSLMNALKSLARIAKEQSHINALTQSLFPMFSMQMSEGLSEELLKQVQRLSGLQKGLSEQLKKVMEELEKGKGGGLEKGLEKALEEMETLAKEMEKGTIDRKLIERQERILSRLLEAQRSIHKREWTKKRFAEPGKTFTPSIPPAIVKEEDEKIREKLNELPRSSYTQEEKRVLREYYEKLLKE